MTNDQIQINASLRSTGKGVSGKIRRNKQVPAVLYGPKTENVSVVIERNEAVKYTGHGFENTIFTLNSDEKSVNQKKVLVKSVDRHPTTHLPIHIDFYAPDMAQTVKVNIEIRFEGKAAGLMEGGLVNFTRRDVEVECLPNDIPEFFVCDLTDLALNESMHASDLPIPEGVKLMTSGEESIANCAVVEEMAETPTTEAADAAAAVEGAEGAAAPAEADKKD